jgi:hypothetical protein
MINFKELFVVIEDLEIKPCIFGNVGYASWDYLLYNFKSIDGDLDKIIFDRQMNVARIYIENVFGVLFK